MFQALRFCVISSRYFFEMSVVTIDVLTPMGLPNACSITIMSGAERFKFMLFLLPFSAYYQTSYWALHTTVLTKITVK